MNIYLDFETYYLAHDRVENTVVIEPKYTLKGMSMEAYIRDPRFEVHLLSVAIDDNPVLVFPAERIPWVLSQLPLEDGDTWTFAQNAKFDVLILSQIYNKYVANPICTRAMSRWTGVSRLTRESQAAICEFLSTGEKGTFIESMSGKHINDLDHNTLQEYMAYNIKDVIDLRANAKAMLPYMTQESMEFISMTTKMYTEPVFILDKNILVPYYNKLEQAFKESQVKLQHLFKFESTELFLRALRSKPKFCGMLTSIGGVVPYKISAAKTETARKKLEDELVSMQTQLSICDDLLIRQRVEEITRKLEEEDYIVMEPALAKSDLEFMALQAHPNENIALLATARAQNNGSQAMSRTKTFLDIAERGLLCVPLEPYQALTSRYTGGGGIEDVKSDGVNIQNLSKRSGDKTLRHAITVPEGHSIIAGDSAQIEARVSAWIAGADNLLQDFIDGEDPYCRFASNIYPYSYEEIYYWTKGVGAKEQLDKTLMALHDFHRFVGKTGILQLGYGSGFMKLALYLSQNGVSLYRMIPELQKTGRKISRCDEHGQIKEYIDEWTPTGNMLEDRSKEAHEEECNRVVTTYRSVYNALPTFWRYCNAVIQDMFMGGNGWFGGPNNNTFYYDGNHKVFGRQVPGIMFPNGYWLRYPNLHQVSDEKTGKREWRYDLMQKGKKITKRIYGSMLFENICQGFSFAILSWQALKINEQIPVKLNVHDEWAVVTESKYTKFAEELIMYWLTQTPDWAQGIPLAAEVNSGLTYGEV